jgi:hypothetical protein
MKRQHPIEKLCRDLDRRGYDYDAERKIIARHVKPLLDELERGIRIYYPAGPNQRRASDLLAAWKEPLK